MRGEERIGEQRRGEQRRAEESRGDEERGERREERRREGRRGEDPQTAIRERGMCEKLEQATYVREARTSNISKTRHRQKGRGGI